MQAIPLLLLFTCLYLGPASAVLDPRLGDLLADAELSELDTEPALASNTVCIKPKFQACLRTFQTSLNYTTYTPTYEGLSAAMDTYVRQSNTSINSLCGFAQTFTTCLGNTAQQTACLTLAQIMDSLGVNKMEAYGFQGIFYGVPAECKLKSQINTIANNFQCFTSVPRAAEMTCMNATGVNFTGPNAYCNNFEKMSIRCASMLYQNCSMNVEKAVCQLIVASWKAIPSIANMTANCVINCTQLLATTTTTMAPHVTTTKGAANFPLSSIAFLAGAALLLWRSNN